MKTIPNNKQVFSAQDLADIFEVSLGTINNWLKQDKTIIPQPLRINDSQRAHRVWTREMVLEAAENFVNPTEKRRRRISQHFIEAFERDKTLIHAAAQQTQNMKYRRRALAMIDMFEKQDTRDMVAAKHGVSVTALYQWVEKWLEQGFESLR